MNIQEKNILKIIATHNVKNQRILVSLSNHSLGIVNRSVKYLRENNFIDNDLSISKKGQEYLEIHRPKNAIILAAGFGMRMVPINMNVPKAFLEVKSQILIERLILQLRSKGILEIYIVVGFQKEKFEYLIDKYGVKLIVNSEYATKNNLYSLALARKYVGDSYIVPCDLYAKINPFESYELYSYYMISDKLIDKAEIRVNRNLELVKTKTKGNKIFGITYITKEDSKTIIKNLEKYSKERTYDFSFWEETLFNKNKMILFAKIISDNDIVEINTYEDLLILDEYSKSLKSEPIEKIILALNISLTDIKNIKILKKGMTNRSFLFEVNNKKYIMRIPGEGTDKLISRKEEKEVYEIINNKEISDDVIYIDAKNGYKITKFIPNGRSCDINNIEDLKMCMAFLKKFHNLKLKVLHKFDIFKKINFYEKLWGENLSAYSDYEETKNNIFTLKKYIEKNIDKEILTHVDAVPDNFLIFDENIRLLDWEYAAMQDPHIDIAMFSIYALYDREEIDRLIDIYFENNCEKRIKLKIYCYVAVCGLLWSNWCEYKRNLGVEFGEYSLQQYRYAKEYYKIVIDELNENDVRS